MPQFTANDTIFSTGVFLAPTKLIVDGVEQWCWVAVGFEDDSFFNGELINPNEYATKLEELVESEADE